MSCLHSILTTQRGYEKIKGPKVIPLKSRKRKVPEITVTTYKQGPTLIYTIMLQKDITLDTQWYTDITNMYDKHKRILVCKSVTQPQWLEDVDIQVFLYHQLDINIFQHRLVPEYRIIPLHKAQAPLKHLPHMLITDPIAKLLGVSVGTLLEIKYKHQMVGIGTLQRIVVSATPTQFHH